MSKTYVYEGSEVVLTGRTARKESSEGVGGRRGRQPRRIDILHEVEPSSKYEGTWKKWVRMTDLYEIVNEPKNDTGGTSEESISSGEEGGDADWPDSE